MRIRLSMLNTHMYHTHTQRHREPHRAIIALVKDYGLTYYHIIEMHIKEAKRASSKKSKSR